MFKRGKTYLLLILASLLAMPFPCAIACGLDFSQEKKQENVVASGIVRTCHSIAEDKSSLPPVDFSGSSITYPAPNNCPILISLNQGWSHSLVASKAYDTSGKQLALALMQLDFHSFFVEEAGAISFLEKYHLPPPKLPLYLINPVLRV